MTPALSRLLERPRIGAPNAPARMAGLCAPLMASRWWHDARCIKIVGSNAKGTTAHIVSQWACEMGHKVGLFTSPHLLHPEERICLNGDPITPEAFEDMLDWALTQASPMEGAGRFEILCLAALKYFADEDVDLAVMEIGLGGRLDPVRIAPGTLNILTSLDLEHTELLGNTLAEIAHEKAHVCKEGDTLISGHTLPAGVLPQGVSCVDLSNSAVSPLRRNALLAQKALEMFFNTKINTQAPTLKIPARLQKLSDGPTTYLDVAHTPAALAVLLDHLPDGPLHLVFGLRNDKDLEAMVDLLAPRTKSVQVYPMGEHMKPPQELLGAFDIAHKTLCADLNKAQQRALDNCGEGEIILLLGGFTLAAHVLARMNGLDPDGLISL